MIERPILFAEDPEPEPVETFESTATTAGGRRARLICGHVLDVLRSLPDASIHCVVTSPPYWGLRDYKLAPQAWGGAPGCAHDYAESAASPRNGRDWDPTAGVSPVGRDYKPSGGAFCRCGAWRGSLGLEPTIGLYLSHLVEVFAEVWRVLRDDGTLWLNIGDSYAGSWGSQGHRETEAIFRRNSIKNHPKRASHTGAIRDSGLKPKDCCLIPFRLAIALQEAGWYVRMDNVWAKPSPMPESVTDRPTRAHEYVFLLSKSARYFYDADAVREPISQAVRQRPYKQVFNSERFDVGLPGARSLPRRGSVRKADALDGAHGTAGHDGNGMRMHDKWSNPAGRNLRSVWTIAGAPFPEAHFATFPPALAERCIKAGCPNGGTAVDPFGGAGTTAMVALRLGRNAISIDLSPEYTAMAERRIAADQSQAHLLTGAAEIQVEEIEEATARPLSLPLTPEPEPAP